VRLDVLTRRWKLLVAAGVVAAAAAVLAVTVLNRSDETGLPEEFSVEALQTASDDPAGMRQRMRQALGRDDLTDQQRAQLRRNMREVRQTQMNRRLDEYFLATGAQREAVLDRHLDEMLSRMRQRQQQPDRPPGERFGRRADDSRGAARRGPDGRRNPPTREQRKQRSESRNPDMMARRMAYMTAMRQRAQERGIEMPLRRGMGPPPPPR